jgi:hypothetical protein
MVRSYALRRWSSKKKKKVTGEREKEVVKVR